MVRGGLTLRGVTRPVDLAVQLPGFGSDDHQGTRCGLGATAQVDRTDFGMRGNKVLDGGAAMLDEVVRIALEVEAVLES